MRDHRSSLVHNDTLMAVLAHNAQTLAAAADDHAMTSAVVDAVVKAASGSRQVTLFGPPRSGRSLCLRRVATRLRRSGKTVAWFDPGYATPASAEFVLVDRTDVAP